MTPERWQKLRNILEQAMDLPVAERAAFLDQAAGEHGELRREIEAMLAVDDREDSRLERPALEWAGDLLDDAVSDSGRAGRGDEPSTLWDRPAARSEAAGEPGEIGPYQLGEMLGRGGMGEVFLAHRSDEYRQTVAIKLLRPGHHQEALLERFLRERQILADLEHPNIAKLMDGGTTGDGRPFLVMEYVKGLPIDVYCRRRELDVEQRLRLFSGICDAIQFAHQNLVVHRDLKPSNILVTEDGRPKLLDFGIAKILQPESFALTVQPTQTGLTPMTPEYASPEQIRGQAVTTATDVYALGVVLYELLTGRRPYRLGGGDFKQLVDDICNRPPTRASSAVRRVRQDGAPSDEALERRLTGDVDAMLARALSKEPGERYASAAQLRDDIDRHLSGLPVSARRQSFLYSAGKFVRRHRVGVSAGALALLTLVAVLATLFAQQRRLLEEQERRLLQWQRAEGVTEWMLELFELPAPSRARGEQVTARELLDLNARSISAERRRDPELLAELTGTIGQTYAQLGLYEEGLEHLRRSVYLHRRHGVTGDDSSVAALAARLQQLSDVLTSKGDYRAAVPVAREALALRQSVAGRARAGGGRADGAIADSLGRLGHLYDLLGDAALGSLLLAEALEIAETAGEPAVTAKILEYAAEAKTHLDEVDAAAGLYRRALEILDGLHSDVHGDPEGHGDAGGALHPDIALMKANLARAESWDDPQAAEILLRQAIDEQEKVFEGAHPVLATALNNLGLLLYETARHAEAREVLMRANRMQEELSGAEHPKVAVTLANLANAEAALGQLDLAEDRLRRALKILRERVGEWHPNHAVCLNNLAELHMRRGEIDRAETLLEQARRTLEEALGTEHPRLASVLNSLGQVQRSRGRPAEAESSLSRAVTICRASLGDRHPILPSALFNLAVVLTDAQRPAEAAERLEEASALVSARGGPPVFAAEIDTRLADVQLKLGRLPQAEARARKAHDAWRRLAGESSLWTLSAQATLGLALLRQGRAEQAAPLLTERLAMLEASQKPTSRRLRLAYEYVIELYEALGDEARAAEHRRRLASLPPL